MAVTVAAALAPSAGAAQEFHWSDQFGNRSTLLNGTMIAAVEDLGAVFYNPGRLPLLERAGFLLTARAYEATIITVDGSEALEGVEDASVRSVPSLVAGRFSIPGLERDHFAYSFFTRRTSDFDLLYLPEGVIEPGAVLADGGVFAGAIESESSFDENWVGLSWGRAHSERVAFGVSLFGTYTGRRRHVSVDVQSGGFANDDISSFKRLRTYSFSSYNLLAKGGVAIDLEPFSLGLSLTTPRLFQLGRGTIRYEDLLALPGEAERDDVLVSDRQSDLPLEYRSPWALGLGTSWEGDNLVLHASAEWYSGVDRYRIMGAEGIPELLTEEELSYTVVDELQSVLNWGFGIEWKFGESLSGYGSIARDASAAPADLSLPLAFGPAISNSTIQADGVHVGGGFSVQTRWIDLTLGLNWNRIRDTLDNPLYGEGGFTSPLPAVPTAFGVKRSRWRVLIGFSVPFVESEPE